MRVQGLRIFPRHARVLRLMSEPGAYAKPDGSIPLQYCVDGRPARIDGVGAMAFERRGWISRAAPPADSRCIFVFTITSEGREALANITDREHEQSRIAGLP